ncbi:hypothetical protein KQI82_02270 [Oscillibacter sp. MSJ-2]|uniref:Uncharacterized protein n=1 Tax=Dysosmobacter acutus TaxID=2841504 RepID=A0ABS6F638_9FIRM|nr:hypothetical protein [Dysosmobacter acutus]MBU5625759.1 hypothetical protein [Dysosmobacter acutus]
MKLYLTKRQKPALLILSLFAVYICLSILLGFPLGFGKMMARGAAREYCSIVYPQATLGKTVFNPVSSSYETLVHLGEERLYIHTNPNQDTVGDPSREELFLEETGVSEVISKLHRTYVQGRYYRFLSYAVYWNHNDPMTPLTSLRFDYGDYESPSLPSEEQIKELISPIALDCITQVEKLLPLDNVYLLYYHPDFKPDKRGMTWRSMNIPLDNSTPRTKELLDTAELKLT